MSPTTRLTMCRSGALSLTHRSLPEGPSAGARHAPAAPGVYRMLDGAGEVLYVGKAKNIKKRVTAYARLTGHDTRIERMIAAMDAAPCAV